MKENIIFFIKVSLKFILKAPNKNKLSLGQLMACWLTNYKSLTYPVTA